MTEREASGTGSRSHSCKRSPCFMRPRETLAAWGGPPAVVLGTKGRGGECVASPSPRVLPSPSPACGAGSPPLDSFPAEETSFVRRGTNPARHGRPLGAHSLALPSWHRAAAPERSQAPGLPRHARLARLRGSRRPRARAAPRKPPAISQSTNTLWGLEITLPQGDKGAVRPRARRLRTTQNHPAGPS